jgi:hypothetical protein
MTFSEIIKSNTWLSVLHTLERLFPDQKDLMEDYEKVFNELKVMKPSQCNITIDIHWVDDDYDQTKYVDVTGYYTNPADRTDEFSNSLAIEFVPWDERMAMPIDSNSIVEFNELEIIAYCLNEMTYAGFEQQEIQAEMNSLKAIKDEYDGLTTEEKAKRTITLDEMMGKLKKDDNKNSLN